MKMTTMIQKQKKKQKEIPMPLSSRWYCEQFQLYSALGLNYTVLHSNGINEPTEEKDVSGGNG